MAHPGGRPPLYSEVEELQKVIDQYFAECDPHWVEEEYWDYPLLGDETETELEVQPQGGALKRSHKVKDYRRPMVKLTRMAKTEQQPYTMAGLARRLGMSRQALMEYKNGDQGQEFGDAIKAARAKVEEYNERVLLSGKNATGAIFNLKVNFGYHEDTEENPPPINPVVFVNNVPVTPPEQSPQT